MMKFKCCRSDVLLLLILFVPYNVYAAVDITKIPEKGYCADAQCQKPIAVAAATVKFHTIHANVLSAKERDIITLYSRSDDKKQYPLVEIDGKRGFFPPNLFRINKQKVKNEEVNVPVQFFIKETGIIVKAQSNEISTSLSEASNITSSTDSNASSVSSEEPPAISNFKLAEPSYKGSFFADASAAEQPDSQSDYAPGHSPQFPASNNSSGSAEAAADSQGQVSENIASQEAVTPRAEEASTPDQKEEDYESSTEKSEETSAGMEDDEDDDEDEDFEIVSEETLEYSKPIVPSLQSSINDKTEAAESFLMAATESVHPSTQSESSAGTETPLMTPMSTSSLPPLASSEPPLRLKIQASKSEMPVVASSDATTMAPPADETTAEPTKSEDFAATTESVQAAQAQLNLTEATVDPDAIVSKSAEPDQQNASTASADTVSPVATFNQTDEISAREKADESPVAAVNVTDRSAEPREAVAESAEQLSMAANETDPAGTTVAPVTTDTVPVDDTASATNETNPAGTSGAPVTTDTVRVADTASAMNETNPAGTTEAPVTTDTAPAADTASATNETNPAGTIGAPVTTDTASAADTASATNETNPAGTTGAPVTTDTVGVAVTASATNETNPAGTTEAPVTTDTAPAADTASATNETVPGASSSQEQPNQEKVAPPAPTPNAYRFYRPTLPTPQAPVPAPVGQVPASPPPGSAASPQPYGVPPVEPYGSQPSYPPAQPQDQQLPAQSRLDSNLAAQSGELPAPAPSQPAPNLYDTLSRKPIEDTVPSTTEGFVDNAAVTEDYETTTSQPMIPEDPDKDLVQSEDADSWWWHPITSLFSSPEAPEVPIPEVPASLPEEPKPVIPEYSSNVAPPAPKEGEQSEQYSSRTGYSPPQEGPQQPVVMTCPDGSLGPDCPQESFLPFQVDHLFAGLGVDSLLTRIIAAGVTLLLCIIAYFFLQNRRMDGSLVARVNSLERELMVLSKENTLLKEENASNIGEGQLEVFLKELEEAKAARADLEEQVATLERDLDEAAEANIELNQMLEQTLDNPKGSTDDVLASVERLQAQLDGQRDTIGNMTRSLSSKNAEIEGLKAQMTEFRETISGLEAEVATLNDTVATLRREKEDANIAHVEKLQEVQNQLAEVLANKVLEESRLGSELSSVKLNLKKTRQIVVAKESEVEALRDSLKKLKAEGVSEDKLAKLFDAVKLHAQVEQLTQERNELDDSLRGEGDARKRLEDHVRIIEEEVNKLRVNYEEAQKEKTEAQTRLEVLSNYFKEKEAQLKKELDLQEILLAQQRGDENSVIRQVQSLQEEVETYRSQNESLKREILDQERDLKGQIATIEKKSHDNWVSARQAERKLEESKQEASQLRNRLTLVEKNLSSTGEAGGVEANGEGGVVSPVMGLPGMGPMGALMGPMGPMIPPPPPPIDPLDPSSGLPPFMFPPLSPGSLPHPPHSHSHPPFMPPLPPPPLLAGDRRPPPLGRMSSPPTVPPPPPGHFSPPPPHYDRLDRPSQSPSPTYHRSPAGGERQGFRPFTKPSPRKPTDYRGSNLSTGQSSEPVEKTRTNERV